MMIDILLVDDSAEKVSKVIEFLSQFPELSDDNFIVAPDRVGALKVLETRNFDLLIIDLFLPNRFGENPESKIGSQLLEQIHAIRSINKPHHIIGLTSYDEGFTGCGEAFNDHLWALLKYDITTNQWKTSLEKKIKYLISSKRALQPGNSDYNFDIAIVVALHDPELSSILNLPVVWKEFRQTGDSTIYHEGVFSNGNKTLKVVAAASLQMGMVATATLSMKLIEHYRPKYLVMTGIAAGTNDDCEIGDILAPENCWDYGSGKISGDDGGAIFKPDPRQLPLDAHFIDLLKHYKSKRNFLNEIKTRWPAKKPTTDLNLHIGPFASGAAVIDNNQVIEDIKGSARKLIGIDMEAYAVFFAAHSCTSMRPSALVLKSVSDFAHKKSDDYQSYAAYVSANFLYNFALAEF